MGRAAGSIDRGEVGAMLAEEADDLELEIECASRARRAGRLRREMKRRRAARPQAAVGSRPEQQQLAYGACAPRTDRPMEGRRAAAVAMVQRSAVLHQDVDDR
jgi:hypothetical protein